ncbi:MULTISPECIES: TIGR04086 family membrane protein [Caproicibacterium]|uniref:TIGR04086 family membrane protein n=1 Tax=Caproicibacterium argilliputei TaxID=3030016 RepID=A0AA97D647_9FIRM|nr:TIGR04086 family membrane protein [Caproicibacterium argilliputei]WOC31001.1 TIGR04086 family membrane protein [Caproicibacterium argilliputei]
MKSVRMIPMKPGMLLLRSALFGIVGGTAICTVLLLLSAAVIQASGKLPQDLLQPLVLIICGVSAFFSGVISAKISGKRGLLLGAGCGFLLFLLCMLGGVVNTHDVASLSSLTRMLVMVSAGALGGYLSVYRRQKIR